MPVERAKSSPANLYAGRVRGRVASYENPSGVLLRDRTGASGGVYQWARGTCGNFEFPRPPFGGGERVNLDLIHIYLGRGLPGDSLVLDQLPGRDDFTKRMC